MEPTRFAQIVSGALTLIFASVYLIMSLFASFKMITDLALWIIGISCGIMFIVGLVLMMIVIITPDHPIIAYSGGILTVFFGSMYTGFSVLPLFMTTPFGYAVVFAVIFIIAAMVFLAVAKRYY